MSRCGPKAYNIIIKEALAQVFSCEFCEISKNNKPLWWLLLYPDVEQLFIQMDQN